MRKWIWRSVVLAVMGAGLAWSGPGRADDPPPAGQAKPGPKPGDAAPADFGSTRIFSGEAFT